MLADTLPLTRACSVCPGLSKAYVDLLRDRLDVFRDERDERAIGSFPLVRTSIIRVVDEGDEQLPALRHTLFEVSTAGKAALFRATSASVREKWVAAIRLAIARLDMTVEEALMEVRKCEGRLRIVDSKITLLQRQGLPVSSALQQFRQQSVALVVRKQREASSLMREQVAEDHERKRALVAHRMAARRRTACRGAAWLWHWCAASWMVAAQRQDSNLTKRLSHTDDVEEQRLLLRQRTTCQSLSPFARLVWTTANAHRPSIQFTKPLPALVFALVWTAVVLFCACTGLYVILFGIDLGPEEANGWLLTFLLST